MAASYIGRTDLPRGIRDNNPGNLDTGQDWKGESGVDGPFAVFSDISWGLRALALDLTNVYNNDGLQTITDIITHYAPPSENDTQSYINNVSITMNVPPDQVLTFPDDLPGLMRGIIMQENGAQGNIIQDADITNGMQLAGDIVQSTVNEAADSPAAVAAIVILFLALGILIFRKT